MGSSFNLPQFITCLAFLLSISRLAILPPTQRSALPLQSGNGDYMPGESDSNHAENQGGVPRQVVDRDRARLRAAAIRCT